MRQHPQGIHPAKAGGMQWLGKLCVLLLVAFAAPPARADFLVWALGDAEETDLGYILEGQVTQTSQRTIQLNHPKFGQFYFTPLFVAKVIKTGDPRGKFNSQIMKAASTKNADQVLELGRQALKAGYLDTYYNSITKTLALDPANKRAQMVAELREKMKQPIPEADAEEEALRKVVKVPRMKVARSPHFVLLHDTPDKPAEGQKLSRAKERLALLEQVYESFLNYFYAQGVPLEVPTERLQVVLFEKHDDYLAFATSLDESLRSASGFYDSDLNISFFFDHGSTPLYQVLQEISTEMQEEAKELQRRRHPARGEVTRLAKSLDLMFDVLQENEDLTVVSHEGTHHLSMATGLLPRQVRKPTWVDEGMATFFEAPRSALWAGIGAVNNERLWLCRDTKELDDLFTIDYIVSDRMFRNASTLSMQLNAYARAWGLMHFLLERHFVKTMHYFKLLGEMPRDLTFEPKVNQALFDQVFDRADREAMEREWRSYLRELKTVYQQAEAAASDR